jgi:hypothetical protein
VIRSKVNKVMWVGRATVFLVSLSVILALVFGVASTAFGHTGYRGLLHLGHSNAGKALTQLVGTLAMPLLKLDNNGSGPALQLEAGANRPPLVANADSGTATNLSADKLDGKNSTDFYAAGSKVADSDLLDGQNSGAFSLAGHDHDSRYYTETEGDTRYLGKTEKAADSDKLDNLDSSAFGIKTQQSISLAHHCDGDGWNECASVMVVVPQGRQYVVSVWSSLSAKDDTFNWQESGIARPPAGPAFQPIRRA